MFLKKSLKSNLIAFSMLLVLGTIGNTLPHALAASTSVSSGSQDMPGVVNNEQQIRTPLSFAETTKIRMLQIARKSVVSVIGVSTKEGLANYLDRLSVNASLSSITTPILAANATTTLTQGTGFVIGSYGVVMTNKHVVEDPALFYGIVDDNGQIYAVDDIQKDPVNDIAILRVTLSAQKTLVSFSFANTAENAQVGQTAYTLGNTLGKYVNTINQGLISGLRRTLTAYGEDNSSERLFDMIQTDASISQGNSGGPLIDSNGKVLGMNTAFDPQGENIGFAIHSKYLTSVYKAYLKYGYIPRPFLGVQYIKVTREYSKSQNLSSTFGAYITADEGSDAVVKNSPAVKAGFQSGDIILSVGGLELKGDRTLSDVLALYRQEEKVTFKVKRGSKEIFLEAKLENRRE